MPQYYVCVTVLLIFMSTRLIGSDGFRHLFAYYTFTENLSPVTHGSINGALWTMGVIFQFYLIAPLLYRAVKKKLAYLFHCGDSVYRFLQNLNCPVSPRRRDF